jgi:hypothetical protein
LLALIKILLIGHTRVVHPLKFGIIFVQLKKRGLMTREKENEETREEKMEVNNCVRWWGEEERGKIVFGI